MTATSSIDLRPGRYQDALSDVECDALIVDAPYSDRTHAGHDEGSASTNRVRPEDEKRLRVDKRTGAEYAVGVNRRRSLNYAAWTPDDVRAFVEFWHPRTRGWFVSMTDHVLARAWEEELERAGRYVFSPLVYLAPGSRVRIGGDGPAQWSCWIVVARPRSEPWSKWGALPGGYCLPRGYADRRDASGVIGGKELWIMRELVRAYSKPDQLVCDPCAGGGTTLLAAVIEGRRAVGAEAMHEHYELAQTRFARGFTPTLFAE